MAADIVQVYRGRVLPKIGFGGGDEGEDGKIPRIYICLADIGSSLSVPAYSPPRTPD